MNKLTFKQWYALIVLVVFIIYGWLYLMEHRYVPVGDNGAMFDTWKWEYVTADKFFPDDY